MTAPKRWMTPTDVAAYSEFSVDTVCDALRAGELVGHQRKAGGRWRVEVAAVDAWLRGEEYRPEVQTITRRRAS